MTSRGRQARGHSSLWNPLVRLHLLPAHAELSPRGARSGVGWGGFCPTLLLTPHPQENRHLHSGGGEQRATGEAGLSGPDTRWPGDLPGAGGSLAVVTADLGRRCMPVTEPAPLSDDEAGVPRTASPAETLLGRAVSARGCGSLWVMPWGPAATATRKWGPARGVLPPTQARPRHQWPFCAPSPSCPLGCDCPVPENEDLVKQRFPQLRAYYTATKNSSLENMSQCRWQTFNM